MSLHSPPSRGADTPAAIAEKIRRDCTMLTAATTQGELGTGIAEIALRYSPNDIQQMRRNFGDKIRNITPEYRRQLEMKITGHLPGVWQTIRLMHRQGSFSPMNDSLPGEVKTYRDMVAGQCSAGEGGEEIRLRFLKFPIAGFSMFVQHEPGHPAGTPFPGGDTVQYTNGIY